MMTYVSYLPPMSWIKEIWNIPALGESVHQQLSVLMYIFFIFGYLK